MNWCRVEEVAKACKRRSLVSLPFTQRAQTSDTFRPGDFL